MQRLLLVTVGLAFCAAPAFAQAGTASADDPQVLAQRGTDDAQGSWRGGRAWRDQGDDESERNGARSGGALEVRGWRMNRPMQQQQQQRFGREAGAGEGSPAWQERMARIHANVGAAGDQQGVRIRMRRGDTALDIRCPSGGSGDLNACIGAVGQLLDRLGPSGSSIAPGRSPSPSSPSSAPSAPADPQNR